MNPYPASRATTCFGNKVVCCGQKDHKRDPKEETCDCYGELKGGGVYQNNDLIVRLL